MTEENVFPMWDRELNRYVERPLRKDELEMLRSAEMTEETNFADHFQIFLRCAAALDDLACRDLPAYKAAQISAILRSSCDSLVRTAALECGDTELLDTGPMITAHEPAPPES